MNQPPRPNPPSAGHDRKLVLASDSVPSHVILMPLSAAPMRLDLPQLRTAMASATPTRRLRHLSAAFALPLLASALPAQGGTPQGENAGGRTQWDVTQARGKTRDIDFTTSEGTWMSADLSPDRTWIAFDLLGHVYRM